MINANKNMIMECWKKGDKMNNSNDMEKKLLTIKINIPRLMI
jgi:hypothetical protein